MVSYTFVAEDYLLEIHVPGETVEIYLDEIFPVESLTQKQLEVVAAGFFYLINEGLDEDPCREDIEMLLDDILDKPLNN